MFSLWLSRNRAALGGVLISLTFAALVTILFRTTDLDLTLQELVYSPTEPHWPYTDDQPWKWLHDFATLPGLGLAILATSMLGASFLSPGLARWRYPALYIFALMALGPGLVTNIFGKVLGGRPRPDEIVPFAGPYVFHYPFDPGTPGQGYSLLCGHCSMGFLFGGLFFIVPSWHRWIVLAGSILFGLLIGAGRVIQAAHFSSDILLDGAAMYMLAAALSPIARKRPTREQMPLAQWKVITATAIALTLLIIGFLFSSPVNKERTYRWVEKTEHVPALKHETVLRWALGRGRPEPVRITLEVEKGDFHLDLSARDEPLVIRSLVKGFGFPGAGTMATVHREAHLVAYSQRLKGLFWEVHGRFDVAVRQSLPPRLLLRTGAGDVHLRGLDPARTVLLSGSFALSDDRRFFTPVGTTRYVHGGSGEPVVMSVQADRVIIR